MSSKDTLKEIQEIVSWWSGIRKDFNDLNLLQWQAQRLSGLFLTLASDLAEARTAWASAKAFYEKEVKQKKLQFEKNVSSTQAETQARANTAKLFEIEAMAEALYFGIKHQYDAVKEVLETMRQRIAIIRREWELKNYAG